MKETNLTTACLCLAYLLFLPKTVAWAQQHPPTRIAVLLTPSLEPVQDAPPAALSQDSVIGAGKASDAVSSSMAYPPAPHPSDKTLPINLATA